MSKLYNYFNAEEEVLGKVYEIPNGNCECQDSHLVVPEDISTAFCKYCLKPPVNKLN